VPAGPNLGLGSRTFRARILPTLLTALSLAAAAGLTGCSADPLSGNATELSTTLPSVSSTGTAPIITSTSVESTAGSSIDTWEEVIPSTADGQPRVSPPPQDAPPGPTIPTDPTIDSSLLRPSTSVMSRSTPVRIQVPAIGADSVLLDLGLQADGTLEVPPDAGEVGWFTGGPTPGELGPAVVVGHVDWAGEPGVFYNLRDLIPGNEITVTRADGSVAQFMVSSNEQFPKEQFPTTGVYGNIDHAGLRLITCGGSFDPKARSYEDNIVVFAELVGSTRA